jgi:hypothetical protein
MFWELNLETCVFRKREIYFGGGISRSLQIFLARASIISICLGTVDVFRFEGL